MLRMAGQTRGPIGRIFFCGHSWVAGGYDRLKKIGLFKNSPRETPGPSSSLIKELNNLLESGEKTTGLKKSYKIKVSSGKSS